MGASFLPYVLETCTKVAHVAEGGAVVVIKMTEAIEDFHRNVVGKSCVFIESRLLGFIEADDGCVNVGSSYGGGGDGFDHENAGKSGVTNAVATHECSDTSKKNIEPYAKGERHNGA